MKKQLNEIICGDNRVELNRFPDNYFDCCVTSPPYYGLRNYETEPVIIGGLLECKHEWMEERTERLNGQGGYSEKTDLSKKGKDKFQAITDYKDRATYSNYCLKCGAWRGNIGLEPTPEQYVNNLVSVFREVKRVLKCNGTLWLNLGDSYWGGKGQSGQAWSTEHTNRDTLQKSYHQISGKKETRPTDGKHSIIKTKDLIGIPWRVAFALQMDGWYLRQDIIWAKPNPMPESMKDRCTRAHEYVFLLSKSSKYYFDHESIQEPANYDGRKDEILKGSTKNFNGTMPDGQPHTFQQNPTRRWRTNKDGTRIRNKRSVWIVATKPFKEAHFATFPEAFIEDMIKAGCPKGGIVLDPFSGAGTVAVVAKKQFKNYIGIDLSEKYCEIARRRIESTNIQILLTNY